MWRTPKTGYYVGTACDIILPTIRLKFKPENVRNREVPVPSFLQLPSKCI